MQAVVHTTSLSFAFSGQESVLRDLDLNVPRGAAFGILGPNGAGKSTLLKLLLGLLTPTSGRVELFGRPFRPQRPHLLRQVGSLIEEPHLYAHLSGRDNLRVFATYRGIDAQRIETVLAITQMTTAAGRRVRHYSTGMKQRLALALALLPDPDLLILDEPTNGLDPEGIVGVRELIRSLHRDYGKTILLSSHLLGEVEQVCSHVGVLGKGELLFQGALEELREQEDKGVVVEVETLGPEDLGTWGGGDGDAVPFEVLNERWFRMRLESREAIPGLIDRLRAAKVPVCQVVIRERRLEDYFLQLSQKKEDGG